MYKELSLYCCIVESKNSSFTRLRFFIIYEISKVGFKSKKVVTSPSCKFKSIIATFSFVKFAISTPKLTAIAVFPIPPLFENVDIILHFEAAKFVLFNVSR